MPLAMRARSALLGHDRSQAKRMVGVALIVAIGIWSIGALVRMRRWFPEAFQHAHPLAVVVSLGVVGGVLAAVTTYRNDGLLVGWFSCSRLRPRGSWLYHSTPAQPISMLGVVAALSGVAALVVGTVGYVVGRVIRTTGHAEPADERPEQILRLLVGSNPSRVGRWLLLAGGLTLASIGFVVLTQPSPFMDLFFPIGVINGRPVVGMVVTLAWIGLAALPAYRGRGLLVSWALVCGPIYGVMVAETQTDEFMQLPLLVDAAQSAIPAVVLTGIISVLGYTAGAVVRHRGDRLSSG